MKDTERKAARLVTAGRVVVALVELDDEENIVYVAGTVTGDSGETYDVSVSPSSASCTCVFGENRPGRRHSHTIALQLAAWYEQKEDE